MSRMVKTREPRSRPTRRPRKVADRVADPPPEDGPRRPDRAPGVIVVLVLLVLIASATVRLYELQRPATPGLRRDLLRQGRPRHPARLSRAQAVYPWEPGKEISWPHPEYGKYAIAVGEAAFGYTSFGWRIVPAIGGTLLLVPRLPASADASACRPSGRCSAWCWPPPTFWASCSRASPRSTSSSPSGRCSASTSPCATCRAVTALRWLVLCGVAGGLALRHQVVGRVSRAPRRRPSCCSTGAARGGSPPARPSCTALRDAVLPALALVVLPVAALLRELRRLLSEGPPHPLAVVGAPARDVVVQREPARHPHLRLARLHLDLRLPPRLVLLRAHCTARVHGIISIGNPLLWWVSVAGPGRPRRAGRACGATASSRCCRSWWPCSTCPGCAPRAPCSCTT